MPKLPDQQKPKEPDLEPDEPEAVPPFTPDEIAYAKWMRRMICLNENWDGVARQAWELMPEEYKRKHYRMARCILQADVDVIMGRKTAAKPARRAI